MTIPEINQNTSGLPFTEFWYIIRGISAHYLYIYVYMYTLMSFGFTSCFSRKKVNLLQQQKIIFNSNIHEFSTDFGDTGLCLKML